ncbi:MAG: small subunit ribosomal protein, partial [Campylobacterota bacterium]|nr:small subunit ribosomal protein [Campylobacterota bacterium]
TGGGGERSSISYKKAIKKIKKADFLEKNKDSLEGMDIRGVVTKQNKGGFVVESNGIEFFLPKSLAAFKEGDKPEKKEISARVVKYDPNTDSIILSRRTLLNEKRKEKREILKKILDEKEIIRGEIKKIKSYGLFVDVGGVEGLVHYSEISYKGPVNPSSMYKEGDMVDVVAIDYDKKTKKLSLSIKATQPDPWKDIKDQLEEGDTITVTVSNVEPYGVFVDLGNEIEGFLHISELSWEKNLQHPSDVVKVGDEINAEVIELDIENKKLRVSLKRLQEKPFNEFMSSFKEGDIIKGRITTTTDFGAFVKVGKIEGLLHNEDASWSNKKCKDLFKPNDEVEVVITKIDAENERVSLSRKNLEDSPVKEFSKKHKMGELVSGKVLSVKDFGVFVKLDDGVDGLIRAEDLAPMKIEDVKEGENIEAVISSIDSQRNKIRLSVKRLEKQREKKALNEYNNQENDSNSTLGDVLKNALKES